MSKIKKNPLIYITNDDGPDSIGLKKLIKIVKKIRSNKFMELIIFSKKLATIIMN